MTSYFVILSLGILVLAGCTSLDSNDLCIPTYTLDSSHEINKDDLETINKFYREGNVLWVQKEAKGYTDAPFEQVLYLVQEDKSLVVKHRGLGDFKYYLFEGKPCK